MHACRYFKLNFAAIERHGTVEFRHPGAALDAGEVAKSSFLLRVAAKKQHPHLI